MSAESKTAKAARTAVAKGMAGKKDERTPEQIQAEAIRNLRGNRAAGGHVSPTDVDQLLTAYDALGLAYADVVGRLMNSEVAVAELSKKNEEFRDVYEAENRSTSLTVERSTEKPSVLAAPYDLANQVLTEDGKTGLWAYAEDLKNKEAIVDAAAAQVSET